MTTIGVDEAKNRLAQLLARVERGERIVITRRGVPVAVLHPVGEKPTLSPEQVIVTLKSFRRGRRLDGLSAREIIEEGRQ